MKHRKQPIVTWMFLILLTPISCYSQTHNADKRTTADILVEIEAVDKELESLKIGDPERDNLLKKSYELSALYSKLLTKSLQLTIRPEKKIYRQGEKIRVRTYWKNISDRDVTVAKDTLWILNFAIKDSSGKFWTSGISIWRKKQWVPEYITLKPGQVYRNTQGIPNLTVTLPPGKYYISRMLSGNYCPLCEQIQSNEVMIEIIP